MTDTANGNKITRRTALTVGGAAGVAGVGLAAYSANAQPPGRPGQQPTASAAPTTALPDDTCVLTTEMTEGPYYLESTRRTDITEGKPGAPLALRVTVLDAATCAVLPNAAVEIWHCDQWGYYSGFTGNSPGGTVPPEDGIGDENTFLRGYVLSDASGVAALTSIFPGWYQGRCCHIHVKVHTGGTVGSDGDYEGGSELHTGQFFFDDATVAAVYATAPYNRHGGDWLTLDEDGIYDGGGAASGLLTLTANDPDDPSAGHVATITVGVQTA
ncbi:intradiol ring-cleavage dioxygenase [Glycomyces sp. NPDC048151]|uniref:intradiol ring-cleavage dioxygenase n=1 Tax=Glycomyces sp. NPDC048151 TaxID=3364002 RepID=UPI003710DAF2